MEHWNAIAHRRICAQFEKDACWGRVLVYIPGCLNILSADIIFENTLQTALSLLCAKEDPGENSTVLAFLTELVIPPTALLGSGESQYSSPLFRKSDVLLSTN